MRRKFGILLIVLGSALLLAALALFLHNEQEQSRAGEASAEVMPQMVEVMLRRQEESDLTEPAEETGSTVPTEPVQAKTMPVEKINGYGYIGFLGMPTLEMELPVMDQWDSRRIQIAPCRYWGDMYSNDLVVMAHNYQTHFGKISQLHVGDTVTFTDMDAVTVEYRVVAVDILDPTAVEDMISGEYDLTLFTCTYGGENRVTVRCDRVVE